MTFSAPICAADGAEADGVGDRARGDDRALAGHEARHRGDRADPAGVRQRDVRAGELVGGQRVLARGPVSCAKASTNCANVSRPASRMTGHHERPRAVALLDVDGDPEVHGAVVDDVRLAVDLGEVVRHDRHLVGRRARDRVGDEVGERELVAGGLELAPAGVHRRDGHRAEGGRGRDSRDCSM